MVAAAAVPSNRARGAWRSCSGRKEGRVRTSWSSREWSRRVKGARRSEGGRLARHGVAVAHRRSFSTCAQGGSATWRGRTGWRGPGWANPVPGRWPGRAGGAWPAASHTAGAGQGRGESREKRERIRGLIQNSNFSQRFFLKHEKL